jgi:hypothetical protein
MALLFGVGECPPVGCPPLGQTRVTAATELIVSRDDRLFPG